jgi:hypothetical protein
MWQHPYAEIILFILSETYSHSNVTDYGRNLHWIELLTGLT